MKLERSLGWLHMCLSEKVWSIWWMGVGSWKSGGIARVSGLDEDRSLACQYQGRSHGRGRWSLDRVATEKDKGIIVMSPQQEDVLN